MSTRPRTQTTPRTRTRPVSPRPRRRWHWVAGIVLLLLGLSAAWVVVPFWRLTSQFGDNPARQPSRLYGQSMVLVPGQTLDGATLTAHLDALGYQPAEPPRGFVAGTYRLDDGAIDISRQLFPTPLGEAGGDRLRVSFAGGKVKELIAGGRAVARAWLDPPLVASFYGPELEERRPISIDELPEDLIYAVLAVEDANFLEHGGVSVFGILRAAWVNLREGEVRQGGSTLTQQLVKNIYLTHERTMTRKLREAVLAVMLELRYEKRMILEAYLNEIYVGRSGNVHLIGVGAAAWAYFGKHPRQLSLAEAATLAGVIQSPARYSPLVYPEAALNRRNAVLERLAQLNWIERERLVAAAEAPLAAAETTLAARHVPYFADAMKTEARVRFGVESLDDAGWVLLSTLDATEQEVAEDAIRWGTKALEEGWEKNTKATTPLQAALIAVDPRDGGIRAWVGGRDYGTSQFDRVGQARRQAGSAFKPIVFAAALDAGVVTPASVLQDTPFTTTAGGRSWSPQNSDRKHRGLVTARTALEKSLNVPTARMAIELGLEPVVRLARDMGVESRLDPYPALALGAMEVTPRELVTVYATLAAGGRRPSVHGLTAVFDRNGVRRDGTELAEPVPVLRAEVAWLVTQMLQGVLDRGTATDIRSMGVRDALAGKTGTTNDRRDSWFAGYGAERAALVWVGYDDNTRTKLSGARAALPIWARFMHKTRPADGWGGFSRPDGVITAYVDPVTGGLATDRCPHVVAEVFLADSVPGTLCPEHDGWRALPLRQPPGIEAERESNPFTRLIRRIRGRVSERDGET
ncbi:MAG: PBP1A family penicillin-binding protein [Acidobacteriota bacterium]